MKHQPTTQAQHNTPGKERIRRLHCISGDCMELRTAAGPLMVRARRLEAAHSSQWGEHRISEDREGLALPGSTTIRRRNRTVRLTSPRSVLVKVIGLTTTSRPIVARVLDVRWHGTVRTSGAYLRLCQTDSKVRLRLPSNDASEVWLSTRVPPQACVLHSLGRYR